MDLWVISGNCFRKVVLPVPALPVRKICPEGAPFILPSSPSQVYRQILDLISEWKIRPYIVAEIQDVELARRMALSGEGVVPLNSYTVSMSLPKGGLRVIGGKKE
jgi:DNA-binding transcriptional LysR family regulator